MVVSVFIGASRSRETQRRGCSGNAQGRSLPFTPVSHELSHLYTFLRVIHTPAPEGSIITSNSLAQLPLSSRTREHYGKASAEVAV